MSTPPPPPPTSSAPPPNVPPGVEPPPPEAPLKGWKSALEHTGIPVSWLRAKPRLPSRRMMIFISTVSALTGAYIYDRRECKRIRQEYIDKVKHLGEVDMKPWELPRKVMVYSCKWPGDEEYDRSLKWFKRNVKPILVAAAVDYEFKNGNQYGSLMRAISDEIRDRRRIEAGLDPPPREIVIPGPPRSPTEKRDRELAGGVIIVGRHTFKEYMEGVKRGWTRGLDKVDDDEVLAKLLEDDGHFDEPKVASADGDDEEPRPKGPAPPPNQVIVSPFQLRPPNAPAPPPKAEPSPAVPAHLNIPPSQIPEQPPLALVPYTSVLGFLNIPLMLWDFFNTRKDVQAGAEAAYAVIAAQARPFEGPSDSYVSSLQQEIDDTDFSIPLSAEGMGDLGFDLHAESYWRSSYNKDTLKDITKARERYYAALPEKLATARALARREREPTKDEVNYPPPTEVALRAERLKKEKRWREEEEAWRVLRGGMGVAWDERFRQAFKVFDRNGQVAPPPEKPLVADQE
ncbi:mitochondrial import inner membrane translocase subunit tim54 [Tulasnella sp. UAMH 9824]|nr:mitochondrial import inner membrane translocase subunit tim54 [Tulasnella sp. UAMH 9824]